MVQWSLVISMSLLFNVAVLSVIYFFRPLWLIYVWKRFRMFRAGLKKRHLKVNKELEIPYLERGEENDQVLLFIHGFTGDKEIFCDIVYYLPKKFHMILIDLPGHGEAKPSDDKADYRLTTIVDQVHEFVQAFGLGDKKLNIIGQSMGGAIAGVYAARYGDMLSTVVLICPAAIKPPEMTDFLRQTQKNLEEKNDSIELLPETVEEFEDMIKLVLYRNIHVPYHISQAFVTLKQRKAETHRKVLRDLHVQDQQLLLDENLEKIKVPLLCIWGREDKVLHVSGGEVIKTRVADAEVHVIDECGHAITLDRPRKLVKILTQFLGKEKSS